MFLFDVSFLLLVCACVFIFIADFLVELSVNC